MFDKFYENVSMTTQTLYM